MKISIRIGVSGARPHSQVAHISPVDSTITMFMLCLQFMECYITNFITSLTMNILYVYKHNAINEM